MSSSIDKLQKMASNRNYREVGDEDERLGLYGFHPDERLVCAAVRGKEGFALG